MQVIGHLPAFCCSPVTPVRLPWQLRLTVRQRPGSPERCRRHIPVGKCANDIFTLCRGFDLLGEAAHHQLAALFG
jgi:hypothetical protein